MGEENNSFAEWRTLARKDPARLVDLFQGKYTLLAPAQRQALIARTPEREQVIRNVQRACADDATPLAGLPYVLQDLIDVDGLPTDCGAPFSAPFEMLLEDSSLLDQQLKNLGAVLLAKSVPSEFGIDLRGRNTRYGDCSHADGQHYVCGGGAGSCAHLVSAGWVPLAFGLDSSAGIRIPAAFHGLFGFRMGHNAYAREGIFPIVPTLESLGWMCAHIEDLQSTIEAFHPAPLRQSRAKPRGYLLHDPSIPLTADLQAGMLQLLRQLDIDDNPHANKPLCKTFKKSHEAFATIEARELYAIHRYWLEEYRAHYPDVLRRRIEAGQICTPEKADQAAATQHKVRTSMVDFFQEYDYLVLPISPRATPRKAEWDGQLENDLLRLNAPASLTALPALILPFPCEEGRHGAVQIILNPQKLHSCIEILRQVRSFYG